MNEIRLVTPSTEYSAEIMALRAEMLEANSDFAGCGELKGRETASEWLAVLEMLKSEQTVPNGYAPSSSFLAVRVEDSRVVGIIELRHRIDTPVLSTWGGHIGFSVRPSERNKGYAKEMLRLMLIVCKQRGYTEVLLTCNSDNGASERVILKNGGIFEREVLVDGRAIKRFWLQL